MSNEDDARKPRVQLLGRDGNAFAILGACRRAARAAGWTEQRWNAVQQEMTAGTYDDLLAATMKHFEVE